MGPVGCQSFACRMANEQDANMVFLFGCRNMHITELYYCETHALEVARNHRRCWCGEMILERGIMYLDGEQPKDPKFYPGEYVAVAFSETEPMSTDNEVMYHCTDVTEVLNWLRTYNIRAHSIYKVDDP